MNTKTVFSWHTIAFISLFLLGYLLAKFAFPKVISNQDILGMFSLSQEKSLNNSLFLGIILGGYGIFGGVFSAIQKDSWQNILSVRYVLWLLLGVSMITYIFGIEMPIVKVTQLSVLSAKKNILGTITYLWDSGEQFIAILLVVFTLLFPLVKCFILYALLIMDRETKLSTYLGYISKFSMLDVFVTAVIIAVFKTQSKFMDIESGVGLIYFTISVLLSISVASALPWLMKKEMK